MNKKSSITLCLVALFSALGMALAPHCAFADKRPMALVVMVDVLRADASESGKMPCVDLLRAGKWQDGYNAAFSHIAQIVPTSLPSSAPNHVSIATGFNPTIHGIYSNAVLESGKASEEPTWQKRILDARPGSKALFVYSWAPDANIAPTEGVEYMGGTDAENAAALAARLASPNAPDTTLYFIYLVYHAGHEGSYYSFTSTYLNAVAEADDYIAGCLNAIASRPTFDEED